MSNDLFCIENISKSFSGTQVLNNVSFSIGKGEVRGLVGENGAGKSTLMKILSGVHMPDNGKMTLEGNNIPFGHLLTIQEMGVSVIYQEFSLVEELSVAENIFLRQAAEKPPLRLISWRDYYEKTEEILNDLGITGVNPGAKVSSLSVAHKQMVEIAKALTIDSKLIVMDEPSATLNQNETEQLLRIIRDLKEKGKSIIYITHRLEEIQSICDSVTILKDGCIVETKDVSTIENEEIISLMVGRDVSEYFPPRVVKDFSVLDALLDVRCLRSDKVSDLSFELYRGEILGVGGLTGSGRTELARALCGLDNGNADFISMDGESITIKSVREAIGYGIAYLPEERKTQGLVLGMSIKQNATYAAIKRFTKSIFINKHQEIDAVAKQINVLKIKCSDMEQALKELSGGNQQKVVLAKWLLNKPKIYIMDEPTRGIDVGAKKEIYEIMQELAKSGASILFISSEMPELINLSDRILVMAHGSLIDVINAEDATEERILTMAIKKKEAC
jgi:ABC-type sugar transport system ATPase subunit